MDAWEERDGVGQIKGDDVVKKFGKSQLEGESHGPPQNGHTRSK
jgi:hypothetical protein